MKKIEEKKNDSLSFLFNAIHTHYLYQVNVPFPFLLPNTKVYDINKQKQKKNSDIFIHKTQFFHTLPKQKKHTSID